MTGSRLFEKVTAKREPMTEDELADPRLEPELWAVLLRDRSAARRLVAYLHQHPALLDLEAPAFARAVTTVPGIEAGIAGQVLAVFALRGHLERLVAGEPENGASSTSSSENGATESPRSASSGTPKGSIPSENDPQEAENHAVGGRDGGAERGAAAT